MNPFEFWDWPLPSEQTVVAPETRISASLPSLPRRSTQRTPFSAKAATTSGSQTRWLATTATPSGWQVSRQSRAILERRTWNDKISRINGCACSHNNSICVTGQKWEKEREWTVFCHAFNLALWQFVHAHCSRRGPRFDSSSQQKYQQNMKIWCLGFHKMYKRKKSAEGPTLLMLGF